MGLFDLKNIAGNPLLQAGLGVLANNTGHYGQFAPAFGRGTQQGLQQAQQFNTQNQLQDFRKQQIGLQQERVNQQDKVFSQQQEQLNKRNAAIQKAIKENPEMAHAFAINPDQALKTLYPTPVAPHSVAVYTPDGAFGFNSRTNELVPMINPITNKQVVRASDSPYLQGQIQGAKSEASAGFNINNDIDGVVTTDAAIANRINGRTPYQTRMQPLAPTGNQSNPNQINTSDIGTDITGEPLTGTSERGRQALASAGQPVAGINVPTAAERVSAVDLAKSRAKNTADNESLLKEMQRNLPNLEDVVKELSVLGKKATYTKAGQFSNSTRRQLGFNVGEGAIARKEYIAKVDNEILPLLRSTFGAAFTAKEGESLKATLGDPDASPEEKDAVLDAFIKTKRSQIKALGGAVNDGEILPKDEKMPNSSESSVRKYNPKTGKIE